jgi:hypothetical protein
MAAKHDHAPLAPRESGLSPTLYAIIAFGLFVALGFAAMGYYAWYTTPGKPEAMMG